MMKRNLLVDQLTVTVPSSYDFCSHLVTDGCKLLITAFSVKKRKKLNILILQYQALGLVIPWVINLYSLGAVGNA